MSHAPSPQLDPRRLTKEELDALPYGAIKVDAEGKILSYNAFESKLSGRAPSQVLGKNFFTEVAPCTNVQRFAGVFRDCLKKGSLSARFEYRFPFPTGPKHVEIHMFEEDKNSAWILVFDRTRAG